MSIKADNSCQVNFDTENDIIIKVTNSLDQSIQKHLLKGMLIMKKKSDFKSRIKKNSTSRALNLPIYAKHSNNTKKNIFATRKLNVMNTNYHIFTIKNKFQTKIAKPGKLKPLGRHFNSQKLPNESSSWISKYSCFDVRNFLPQ
jgi:hypothetical protein